MLAATTTLLGGALGDALGYPVEFIESATEILRLYGTAAPAQLLRCSDGLVHVSDDTQMTLFTVEGLVLSDYGWLLDVEGMFARRAPGNTCLSALMGNVQNARTPTTKTPPNDSKGCGAIMRSAPFGLVAENREEAFAWARDTGVLTHGHPSGYLSAAYFASLILNLSRSASLETAMREADLLLARERGHEETAHAVEVARDTAPFPSAATIEALPNGGWVGEWALAIALMCARDVDVGDESVVADAIWRGAAHGGDSDSTASLTGSLLGARGARLPARWLEELELRDVIEHAARSLFQ